MPILPIDDPKSVEETLVRASDKVTYAIPAKPEPTGKVAYAILVQAPAQPKPIRCGK